jgi:dienelactone hydrolase
MRRRVLIAALALVSLARCSPVENTYLSAPPLDVVDARKAPRPLTGTLYRPSGPGPFPVVILLHGCGGMSPNLVTWAARLNGWGYAAVTMDSFGPRGQVTVCAPERQPLVTARDRAGDVISMAVYLRGVPGIDASRIGVVGFSHGGGTAAWVTQARYETQYPNLLKASVDYYGPCRSPETQGSVPLLALAGEADTWSFPARTCRAFGQKLKPDQVFEVHTYPGVVHAFDNPRQAAGESEGHPMNYDHAAAEDSFERTHVFLDRYLRGSRT